MIRNVNAANQHIRIMKNEVGTAKKISFAITGMVYILKIYIFCKLFEIVIIIHNIAVFMCVLCVYILLTQGLMPFLSPVTFKSPVCANAAWESLSYSFMLSVFLQRQRESMSG